ncbi:hypothetical protein T265_06820 [Opisthorchis viverrini]|uniref:Uncharacterized protein n=1 Tax=Opisthorchis viverrini TaxID=6198 RepID=A0A074ZJ44_OPIVI|nr:hypothetical protein T265_06820 [Opisthorchis viverrini]KER25787.1 hypothetical protein T265_06820 [Opisthorchis viverrini]
MISVAEYPVVYPRMYAKGEEKDPPASSSISSYEGIKGGALDTSDSDADNKSFHYSAKTLQARTQPKQTNGKPTTNEDDCRIQDESVMCWLLEQFVQNGTGSGKTCTDRVKPNADSDSPVCKKFLYSASNSHLPLGGSPHETSGSNEKQQWMTSLPYLNKTKPEHHFSRLPKTTLAAAEHHLQKERKSNPNTSILAVDKLFDEIESQMATLDSQNLLILKQLRKAEAIIYDCREVQRAFLLSSANHAHSDSPSKKSGTHTSPLLSRPGLPKLRGKDDVTAKYVNTEISQSSNRMFCNPSLEHHRSKKFCQRQNGNEAVGPGSIGKDYKSFCPEIPTRRFSVSYYPEPEASTTDSSPDPTCIQHDRYACTTVSKASKPERSDRAHSLFPESERVTKLKILTQHPRAINGTYQGELVSNSTQNLTMKGLVTMMRRPFRRKGNTAAIEPTSVGAPMTNKMISDTRCTSTGDVKKTSLGHYEATKEVNVKNVNYQYVNRVRSNEDFIQAYNSEANRTTAQTTTGTRQTNDVYTRRLV